MTRGVIEQDPDGNGVSSHGHSRSTRRKVSNDVDRNSIPGQARLTRLVADGPGSSFSTDSHTALGERYAGRLNVAHVAECSGIRCTAGVRVGPVELRVVVAFCDRVIQLPRRIIGTTPCQSGDTGCCDTVGVRTGFDPVCRFFKVAIRGNTGGNVVSSHDRHVAVAGVEQIERHQLIIAETIQCAVRPHCDV